MLCIFLLLTSLGVVSNIAGDAVICEDYSPCSCEVFDPYGLIVRCGDPFNGQLPITVLDVQKVFNRTKARHLFWLDLLLSPKTGSELIDIPSDILNGKSVDRLGVSCSTASGNSSFLLEIDAKAFRSSAHKLGHFEMGGCDLIKLNWKFLKDTNHLVSLSLNRVVHFQGFPPLPSLARIKSLRIYECADFQHWNEIALRFPRLESLFLDGNLQGDHLVNEVLNSIAAKTGRDTLQQLSLWQSRLTRIPENVASFEKLNYVNLFGNGIRSIQKGSLSFHPDVRVTFLILTNNVLDTIEPGAFQGDFSEAVVYLDFNRLSRFESYVYENLLEQMDRFPSDAGLHVRGNPFNCEDCHLSWLIRDKRHLLGRVHGARCSNGTRFEDLTPESFDDCFVYAGRLAQQQKDNVIAF